MSTIPMVDARVAEIIAIVISGRKVEDSTVELKRDWLPIPKMARRIAAHANEMHGDSILWVIGIDEDSHCVTGCQDMEMANWQPALAAEFESNQAPELILNRKSSHENMQVVALLFDARAVPYVIKVRSKEDGGAMPEFEIPFRNSTRTNTAKRTQVLRMLLPTISRPNVELLYAGISDKNQKRVTMDARMYIAPADSRRLVIPRHRCTIGFRTRSEDQYLNMPSQDLQLWTEDRTPDGFTPPQIVIKDGAIVRISGSLDDVNIGHLHGQPLEARIELGVTRDDRPISMVVQLLFDGASNWNWVPAQRP